MSRRTGPGRGRPPKNCVWNYELGKYVTSSVSQHPSPLQWGAVTDNNETQNASAKDPGGSSLPPPPPMFSWDSDDFEDAVIDVGCRQGPYRNCTRGQRDVSGQYEDGYYAQADISQDIMWHTALKRPTTTIVGQANEDHFNCVKCVNHIG